MVTRATRELNLVRCTAGELVVGVEVGRVAAVERGERLAKRPTGTANGTLRTREGEWPVVALSRWLGAGSIAPTGGQVVLFETKRGRVGLLVDRVSPVERVPEDDSLPIPTAAGSHAAALFSGVALTKTGPLVMLLVDNLGKPSRELLAEPAPLSALDQLLAQSAPKRPIAKNDRLLTFDRIEYPRSGGRPVVLALPLELVAEVYDAPGGTPLPGAEAHVRELVVWRDKPLVVIDAGKWVGLPERAAVTRRVVVARLGGAAVGLLAGPVVQVVAGSLPCVPMRSRVALRRANVLAALDASDQTVIVPDWSRLSLSNPDARVSRELP